MKARTIETAGALKLNINDVTRGFDGGPPVDWRWTRTGEIAAQISALVEPTADGLARVVLRHRVRRPGRDAVDRLQRIALTSTPCRFGGCRWWWICPQTGRRVGVLYLPAGATDFLSRSAHALAFDCCRESWTARSHRRLRKLFGAVGGRFAYLLVPIPPRPAGMHRRRYARVVREIERTRSRLVSRHFCAVRARARGSAGRPHC